MFDSRSEFINAQASEKLVLVHVEATSRLVVWTDEAGLWSKTVPHYVVGLKIADSVLTSVSDQGSVVPGTFYYNPQEGKLYIADDPTLVEMIVTYRLFYSTRTLDGTWDLGDTSIRVPYIGRIIQSPQYKHKIGVDQNLVSLVGKGTLILNNNDGYFDELYDQLFFENQTVSVYTWNKDLPISEAKIIFRGKVTDKAFASEKMTLIIKDSIFDMAQFVPQTVYDDSDNVSDSVKGQYKRVLYGRVDGLKLQSVDQIADGYEIAGTLSSNTGVKQLTRFEGFESTNGTNVQGKYFVISTAKDEQKIYYWYGVSGAGGGVDPMPPGFEDSRKIEVALGDNADAVAEKTSIELASKFDIIPGNGYFLAQNKDFGEAEPAYDVDAGITITTPKVGVREELITGVGSDFLQALSPDDLVTVGTQELTVEAVLDDNNFVASDAPDYPFTNLTGLLVPEIPTTVKNRTFFVANHICAALVKTVVDVKQFNRIQLNDINDLRAGDFLEFASGERTEIKSFAPGNVVVLQKNLVSLPSVGSIVSRPPVQNIYFESMRVESEDYSIDNAGPLKVTLSPTVEFDLTKSRVLSNTLTFTNGSRVVTALPDVNLEDILGPRDWIKPNELEYTTYYEILSVEENVITLRTPVTDATISTNGRYKAPNYIGDNTIISADCLGRTVDGTAEGEWIKTAAQSIKHLMGEIGIDQINEDSFNVGNSENSQIVSLPIPISPGSTGTPVKTAVDELTNSVLASITLDNDLRIKYNALLARADDENIKTISDKELISWNVRAVNGNIYRNAVIRYRHKDIDRFTLEEGNSVASFGSDFVKNYIGTEKTSEVDARLYEQTAAEIRSHREVYYNRLSRTQIEIISDLRLENIEIGDIIRLDIRRLYKRLGDSTTRLKLATVVGKEVSGDTVKLILSDLGNLYNSSSMITTNSEFDYEFAPSEDKIKNGYITDNQGVVDDDEDTANVHLIS